MLNPYASHLGNRDAVEVIAASPARLKELARKLGPKGLERSLGPGKWPARGILCHLADCEVVFAFRLRQSLAETDHVIQPFDQDRWSQTYSAYTSDDALNVFSALRGWNLALIRSLPESALSKELTHPERGRMTFRVVLETMGGHDLIHIGQLEGIAGQG
jgi:DinB family protein